MENQIIYQKLLGTTFTETFFFDLGDVIEEFCVLEVSKIQNFFVGRLDTLKWDYTPQFFVIESTYELKAEILKIGKIMIESSNLSEYQKLLLISELEKTIEKEVKYA